MTANVIDPGNFRRLTASFSDADLGGSIDPDVVKLTVLSPDGNTVNYTYGAGTIVRDGIGEYHADILFTKPGKTYFRWWSTGAGEASLEGELHIRERATI